MKTPAVTITIFCASLTCAFCSEENADTWQCPSLIIYPTVATLAFLPGQIPAAALPLSIWDYIRQLLTLQLCLASSPLKYDSCLSGLSVCSTVS